MEILSSDEHIPAAGRNHPGSIVSVQGVSNPGRRLPMDEYGSAPSGYTAKAAPTTGISFLGNTAHGGRWPAVDEDISPATGTDLPGERHG